MKINTFRLSHLRNHEHFQFHTEIVELINEANPETLRIKPQYEAYRLLYEHEDEAVVKIMKSAFSEEIQIADRQRDIAFRGLVDTNRAALNHFRAETASAAKRLQIVFDTYGNIVQKPLDEETAAVYNLLQELNGIYAEDVKTVGIADWVQELEKNNKTFDALVKSRYKEKAERSNLVLKKVREQIDAAYRDITGRINALMLIDENEEYKDFIRRINAVIDRYSNTIAQRAGMSKRKRKKP